MELAAAARQQLGMAFGGTIDPTRFADNHC